MTKDTFPSEEKTPFLLKNMYSRPFVEQVAIEIKSTFPAFQSDDFQQIVFDAAWPGLELKQRIRHISHSLRRCLPPAYEDALGVVVRTVENMVARDGERMTFEWMIFPDFVETFGVETPGISLPALETLTRLASAEFAIRPFLLLHPELAYPKMADWSAHESPMVRRLSSEGFRPRLPWGMGVPVLKKDPSPILPILEKLKNDPAETVRRSVANNLNDISKDHPELVLGIAERWLGQSPETDWVVRHACRGLLKKGHARALALFGYEKGVQGIEVTSLKAGPQVSIGGTLAFSFFVKNTGGTAQNIRLEYAINYLTSMGNISRKVFKIKELELGANSVEAISKKQRFQDFTTRKHFPGTHRLEIVVNGEALAAVAFEVDTL